MDRRIYGLETEYGVACTSGGTRRLTPDEVDALLAAAAAAQLASLATEAKQDNAAQRGDSTSEETICRRRSNVCFETKADVALMSGVAGKQKLG